MDLWNKFAANFFFDRKTGLAVDLSRIEVDPALASRFGPAFQEMQELEAGALANPDEKRMVGHYWLRAPELAPSADLRREIEETLAKISRFASAIHRGEIAAPSGKPFKHILVIGIGGSALGPQFVNQALTSTRDPMNPYFFDNTDPDGMEKVLGTIPDLARTLVVVISKSGGTKETRNGQLIAKEALTSAGLPFAKQFVAVTGADSELDRTARNEGWLERFPMWDWVGGRTSEFSAVGLLIAALQGFAIDQMLLGARDMDQLTRRQEYRVNPAAQLAAAWYSAGNGKGAKDMVVLPYKDRLELFSRYLQQLLMESLGKEHDRNHVAVNQGIAVYGNKGSTDQHAYVQQLRDGVNNFFVVFIEVLRDSCPKSRPPRFDAAAFEVEPLITSGDYLTGFYLGTRSALYEKGRASLTITIEEVNEYSIGLLIALFERAVGLYANLVNINAYHQPGVEAGKKAAAEVLAIQKRIMEKLKSIEGALDIDGLARELQLPGERETIFKICRHLTANGRLRATEADDIFASQYQTA